MYSAGQRHFLWLSESLGSTSQALEQVLSLFGDAEPVWEEPESFAPFMQPGQYKRLMENRSEKWIDGRIRELEMCGGRFVCRLDDDFPETLRDIPDPPSLLYVKGELPGPDVRTVGIVGTRRPSREGVKLTREIGHGLSDAGVTVVSGLALGIDAAAHEGCLAGKSPTVAVLGFGLDQKYPAENAGLFDLIVEKGGALVSEYAPGMPSLPANFVKRNRLISGLSQGVLLVEGAEKSGAMITLKDAERQGRVRFAVPGSPYQINSTAPNALLKEGAVCVTCAEDILNHFGWDAACAAPKPKVRRPAPEGTQGAICRLLEAEDKTFGELAEALKMEAGPLATELTMMEMEGYITALPGNVYRIVS